MTVMEFKCNSVFSAICSLPVPPVLLGLFLCIIILVHLFNLFLNLLLLVALGPVLLNMFEWLESKGCLLLCSYCCLIVVSDHDNTIHGSDAYLSRLLLPGLIVITDGLALPCSRLLNFTAVTAIFNLD